MEGNTAFPSASIAHHRMLNSLTDGQQIASRLMEVDVSHISCFTVICFSRNPQSSTMLRAQHSMWKLGKSLVDECSLASY